MATSLSLKQPPIKTTLITHSEFKHSLVIEPLFPGFGHTLGNSLRRVMLSSIPGFAVTRIKINDDVTHEYQSVQGVVEDALDIILNLKMLRAKILSTEDKVTLTLTKNGNGDVIAGDFDTSKKNVEIANKDLYICTLDKDASLKIEIDITRGIGYLAIDKMNLSENVNPQNILVDAQFNPVTNVSMEVEEMRVGDMTNYHRLTLNFDIDGTVSAQEIINYTLNLLIDMMSKIQSSFNSFMQGGSLPTTQNVETEAEIENELSDLDVPNKKKILNILSKNGIVTKAALKERASELETLTGIDEKMLGVLQEYIAKI